jgi:hypothetical protein
MSETRKDLPEIDFSRISFPSDRLTIKAVRDWVGQKYGAKRFDKALIDRADHAESDEYKNLFTARSGVIDLMAGERELARNAFVAALDGYKPRRIGRQDIDKAGDRRGTRDVLHIDYQRFGLSSGPKQTALLIREIESQAVAQAEEHLGRQPGR